MTIRRWRAQSRLSAQWERKRAPSSKGTQVALEIHGSAPDQAIAAPCPGSRAGVWGQTGGGPYLRIGRRTDGTLSLLYSDLQTWRPPRPPRHPNGRNLALTFRLVNRPTVEKKKCPVGIGGSRTDRLSSDPPPSLPHYLAGGGATLMARKTHQVLATICLTRSAIPLFRC